MGQIAITGIFMITRLWFHDNALNAKKNNSENSKILAIFFLLVQCIDEFEFIRFCYSTCYTMICACIMLTNVSETFLVSSMVLDFYACFKIICVSFPVIIMIELVFISIIHSILFENHFS